MGGNRYAEEISGIEAFVTLVTSAIEECKTLPSAILLTPSVKLTQEKSFEIPKRKSTASPVIEADKLAEVFSSLKHNAPNDLSTQELINLANDVGVKESALRAFGNDWRPILLTAVGIAPTLRNSLNELIEKTEEEVFIQQPVWK